MQSRKLVGVLGVVLVVGLVVAALFAAGSPSTARKEEADRRRSDRLMQLHYNLEEHVRQTGALPEQLEDLSFDGDVSREIRDPDTKKVFEYNRIARDEYEICAIFLTVSNDDGSRNYGYSEYGYEEPVFKHGAGRHCFQRRIQDTQPYGAPPTQPLIPKA